MRAGRLRHRLNLQESTETRNAHGEAIITWATSYTVWGAVEPLSGSEATKAGQVKIQTQYRVIIRYDSSWGGIDSHWRIQNAGTSPIETYDIFSVIKPEHRSHPNSMIEMLVFKSDRDDE